MIAFVDQRACKPKGDLDRLRRGLQSMLELLGVGRGEVRQRSGGCVQRGRRSGREDRARLGSLPSVRPSPVNRRLGALGG